MAKVAKEDDWRAEIAGLRREMAEIRSQREQNPPTPPKNRLKNPGAAIADELDETQSDVATAMEDITSALKDLAEDAEAEFEKQPLAFMAGSFALGLVVGLLLRR